MPTPDRTSARSKPLARPPKATIDRPTTRRIGALRALWPFLRPYRAMMAGAFVALLATAGVSLILPVAVRRVVDGFAEGAQLTIAGHQLRRVRPGDPETVS